jgi:hypothetical protein
MTEMSALESRYRRLLAWYPARHRQVHGDEMFSAPRSPSPPRCPSGWSCRPRSASRCIAGPTGLDIASFAVVYVPALAVAILIAVLGWVGARRRLRPTS